MCCRTEHRPQQTLYRYEHPYTYRAVLPRGSLLTHLGTALLPHMPPTPALLPQAALAEISRVLAPGGVFVASTFLTATAPLGQVLGDDTVRPLNVVGAGGRMEGRYCGRA